uniref:Rab proteins geranylgeranyltransferase component A n=1 Tax=Aceria tosichella TaxID=561515 RepID=A0A6G1S7Q9_9ACAR
MSTSIPSNVDVIIFGTGLTNSILAAACSRIGKSVLHLDENNYYGREWASFTFQQLIDWIKDKYPQDKSLENVPEDLINKSRMFCIDLAPRFLFSNGDMVDLLVKSNVARYHEFKNNIRILCSINDEIHVMPCRRNEVFTSALLNNLADKRRLMKFIELCLKLDPDTMSPEELESYNNIPIKQYLEQQGLKPTLQEYIINSIAMVKPFDTTLETCSKIKKFMIATERYGRSPFLFPLYGCGEFPQSFCRLSAVFGGLYCLNNRIKDIKVLPETVDTAQPEGKKGFSVRFSDEDHLVTSDMLVIEQADAIDLKLVNTKNIDHEHLSRAILFTKSSIVEMTDSDNASSSQEMASFLRIPPSETNTNHVYLIELNSSALVCPKEMHMVYLWTRSSSPDNPEGDLEPTVARLFKSKMDCVMWRFYYSQLITPEKRIDCQDSDTENPQPGLFITNPICDDIDYTNNIKEAERMFRLMCPGEEFLPRAPDPDEIISV